MRDGHGNSQFRLTSWVSCWHLCGIYSPCIGWGWHLKKASIKTLIFLLSSSSSLVSVWPCVGMLACRILFQQREYMVCQSGRTIAQSRARSQVKYASEGCSTNYEISCNLLGSQRQASLLVVHHHLIKWHNVTIRLTAIFSRMKLEDWSLKSHSPLSREKVSKK